VKSRNVADRKTALGKKSKYQRNIREYQATLKPMFNLTELSKQGVAFKTIFERSKDSSMLDMYKKFQFIKFTSKEKKLIENIYYQFIETISKYGKPSMLFQALSLILGDMKNSNMDAADFQINVLLRIFEKDQYEEIHKKLHCLRDFKMNYLVQFYVNAFSDIHDSIKESLTPSPQQSPSASPAPHSQPSP
jgi:hypothetical protein